MVIRASSGQQIDALIADLSSELAVTREAAVARLTVIGARAVDRLAGVAEGGGPSGARVAAFRALDAIGDPRSLGPALRSARGDDPAVAVAAVAALRPFLRGAHGVETLDALTGLVLDRQRPEAVRVSAIEALAELGSPTLGPIWEALRDDASPAIRAGVPARQPAPAPVTRLADIVAEAAQGRMPDAPDTLRHAVAHTGSKTPLAVLQQLVDRLREREAAEDGTGREAWMVARGAAHVALAHRGSRLAVYDLKETLERAPGPVPVEFLSAMGLVGDASCLDAIAAAYARSKHSGHPGAEWWPSHLADVFRTIAKRERLTRRHAVMKRIERRTPGIVGELLKA